MRCWLAAPERRRGPLRAAGRRAAPSRALRRRLRAARPRASRGARAPPASSACSPTAAACRSSRSPAPTTSRPCALIRAGAQDFVAKATVTARAAAGIVRNAVERHRTGERLEVERLVREVAADVRTRPARPRRRRPRARRRRADRSRSASSSLILHHPGGVVLWALFAAAAVVAWRATQRPPGRRPAARGDRRGLGRRRLRQGPRGPLHALNEAAARLLGLDRDAVLGHTDAELFGDAASAARRARDEAVLATGETRRYWRTATSRRRPRRSRSSRRRSATAPARIVGLIGTVRDETDIRRLEQETGRFFDLAPDMLCTAGADGRLERVNEAWTAVLGWTADELRSRPLIDFVHPEDRARAARELELMFAGVIDGCVNRLATRAGGWRDVEWTARVVPEDERIYAVARDVTERNKMEGALAASEARYRTLVHNLPNSARRHVRPRPALHVRRRRSARDRGLRPDVVGRYARRGPARSTRRCWRRATAPRSAATRRRSSSAADTGRLLGPDRAAARRRRRDRGRHAARRRTSPRSSRPSASWSEADERFRTAFEEAPIGMGMVDARRPLPAREPRRCARSPATSEEQLLQHDGRRDHASGRRRTPATPAARGPRLRPRADPQHREALPARQRPHGLGLGARDARARRRRQPEPHPRPDPGHHRAPPLRGAPAAHGRPRPAHRPVQPPPLRAGARPPRRPRRALRRRAARCWCSTSTTSRASTTRSATTPATS